MPFICDSPSALWIPPKPAIIRPATEDLIRLGYLPGMVPAYKQQAAAETPFPITLITKAGFRTTVGNGATWTLPGSPIAGDLILITLASGTVIDSNEFLAEGYTGNISSASGAPGRRYAYKIMPSTPDTDVDVIGNADIIAGIIEVWRYVDPDNPIDDNTRTTDTGTSGLPNPPSYTTVTDNAMRIIGGTLDDDDAAASTSHATFGDVFAYDTGRGLTAGGATAFTASLAAPTPGALDPGAFTGSAGTDAWQSTHFALRPKFPSA